MARNPLAELYVSIRGDASDFAADVRKQVPRMRKAANAIGRVVAASMTAAFVGLSAQVAVTSRNIDNLTKRARTLGDSFSNFRVLQTLARQAGIEVNTLTMGMQRMTRRVAEAAQGTGEAVGVLEELGVDARRLSLKGPTEQFIELSEAVMRVENPSDRVRVAMKLFDSEGVALIRMMGGLNGKFEEQEERLARLGVLLTDLDTQRIEQMNDRVSDMGEIWEGISTVLTAAIAPTVLRVSDNLNDTAERGLLVFEVVSGIANALSFAARMAAGFFDVMNAVAHTAVVVYSAIGAMGEEMAGDREAMLLHLEVAREASDRIADLLSGGPGTATNRTLEEIQAINAEIERLSARLRGQTVELPTTVITSEEGDDEASTPTGSQMPGNLVDAWAPVTGAIEAAGDGIRNLIRRTGDWRDAVAGVADAFVGGVIDSIVQVTTAWITNQAVAWTSSSASAAASQQASAASAQAAASQALAAWAPAAVAASIATLGVASGVGLSAYLGATALGVAGAVAIGAIGAGVSSFAGAALGPGRADGGRVEPGTVYPVNEDGLMEFFSPDTAGEVIPLGDMQAMQPEPGDGEGITINMHFANGVDRATLQQQAETMRVQFERMITDKLARGGSFRQSFAV